MIPALIPDFVQSFQSQSWGRNDLISALFSSEEIQQSYPNEIRRATIIGHLTNTILKELGRDDFCQILAIGDMAYYGGILDRWETIMRDALSQIEVSRFVGYDLEGRGSRDLRILLARYMKRYHSIPWTDEEISECIVPSYGGTDSFSSILQTLLSKNPQRSFRFIFPEASFLANIKIAEVILGKDGLVPIPKPSKDNFFVTESQIDELFLDAPKKAFTDVFYITPVGNPTGNALKAKDIFKVLLRIVTKNPDAVIILDAVYIGLLYAESSQDLLDAVIHSKQILDRIVFTESLSKTLGTTGVRMGWSWTFNRSMLDDIRKFVSLTKAGFSKLHDTFMIHLLSDERIFHFQDDVCEQFTALRNAFTRKMRLEHGNLFDFDASPEVVDREGIYVLLKVGSGHSVEEVFAQTGIIGVGVKLHDGWYIRYAFGNISSI